MVAVGYTSSPVLVAGVAAAFSLPWLLFALPAGALVDRLDRRRVMLAANTLRAALAGALALAVALDAGSIWLLYGVAFGVGVTETLSTPRPSRSCRSWSRATCWPGPTGG